MLFTLLFVTLYALGWLALAFAPWLALSVATRGHAGLRLLPACLAAGVIGGLAVPLLVRDDAAGLALSFAAALILPALLLVAARLARFPRAEAAE